MGRAVRKTLGPFHLRRVAWLPLSPPVGRQQRFGSPDCFCLCFYLADLQEGITFFFFLLSSPKLLRQECRGEGLVS